MEIREAALGPSHPETLKVVDQMAEDYFQISRYDRATALLEGWTEEAKSETSRLKAELARRKGQS